MSAELLVNTISLIAWSTLLSGTIGGVLYSTGVVSGNVSTLIALTPLLLLASIIARSYLGERQIGTEWEWLEEVRCEVKSQQPKCLPECPELEYVRYQMKVVRDEALGKNGRLLRMRRELAEALKSENDALKLLADSAASGENEAAPDQIRAYLTSRTAQLQASLAKFDDAIARLSTSLSQHENEVIMQLTHFLVIRQALRDDEESDAIWKQVKQTVVAELPRLTNDLSGITELVSAVSHHAASETVSIEDAAKLEQTLPIMEEMSGAIASFEAKSDRQTDELQREIDKLLK